MEKRDFTVHKDTEVIMEANLKQKAFALHFHRHGSWHYQMLYATCNKLNDHSLWTINYIPLRHG